MFIDTSVMVVIYFAVMFSVYVIVIGLVLIGGINEFLIGVILFYITSFSAGGMFVYAFMNNEWWLMFIIFTLPIYHGYVYSYFIDGVDEKRPMDYSGIGLVANYTLLCVTLIWIGSIYG